MWYKVGVAEGWENADSLLSDSPIDSHNENNGLMMNLNLRQPITNNIYHNLTLGISNLGSSTNNNTPTVIPNGTYYYTSEFDYKKTTVKYFLNTNQYIAPEFKVDFTGGC